MQNDKKKKQMWKTKTYIQRDNVTHDDANRRDGAHCQFWAHFEYDAASKWIKKFSLKFFAFHKKQERFAIYFSVSCCSFACREKNQVNVKSLIACCWCSLKMVMLCLCAIYRCTYSCCLAYFSCFIKCKCKASHAPTSTIYLYTHSCIYSLIFDSTDALCQCIAKSFLII